MALETPCQTPGAVFHTTITNNSVSCQIDLNKDLDLTEKQAKTLEANIHNALELVLAPYYTNNSEESTK